MDMVGQSPAFRKVLALIPRIARCTATVVIEGETGTGKEYAARAIHYGGPRRAGPFVPTNCGAIPDGVLESELFGHRRGAFTDARETSPGMLRLADSGTLFLDEVDCLSGKAQVALLRFLQERKVRPLGEGREYPVDVRVVCASNRNLKSLVAAGQFRQDLYYRVNVVTLELPPLRARHGDICLLAEHFLDRLSRRYDMARPHLDDDSRRWLDAQSWPGNIRELENFMEREFLLADGSPWLRFSTLDTDTAPSPDHVGKMLLRLADEPNYRKAKERVLEDFNRHYLDRLMRATRGNVALAARTAGKERRAFGRLLSRYAILPDDFRS
jgi:transcriptional regulator with GAF, ATPase, and Fis domain